VKSFVEITRYFLSLDGVSFVLSVKFCHDPLENFFGKQKMKGGYSEKPTVRSFTYGTSSLHVQGLVAGSPVRGNSTRGKTRDPHCCWQQSIAKKSKKINLIL